VRPPAATFSGGAATDPESVGLHFIIRKLLKMFATTSAFRCNFAPVAGIFGQSFGQRSNPSGS
jgi:hypothetical protein